jgi:hypothetical protein
MAWTGGKLLKADPAVASLYLHVSENLPASSLALLIGLSLLFTLLLLKTRHTRKPRSR